jgi:hypothetical protein
MLSAEVSARLEVLHPSISSELNNMAGVATDVVDPRLLALCASYIDAALCQRDWTPPANGLTAKERAFIAFTEQFTTSVSTMTDEQVDKLLEYASADEVYNFASALYVVDMTRRLDLVAGKVLI